MTKTDVENFTAVIAALNARLKAPVIEEVGDRPFASHRLEDLAGGIGILKAADHIPAVNMAAQAPDMPMAYDLEVGRFTAREQGKKDRSNRRGKQARARQQRRVEFDRLAEAKVTPPQARLDQAWLVVFHLVGIVSKIARGKQRWANRLLGGTVDDIPQVAMEQMALMLARQSKWDLPFLQLCAQEMAQREKGIPGNQVAAETDSEERKRRKKACKWLMGMVNNRVKGALADAYTSERHLRWDNLDMIGTVMETINGVGDDPTYARFKADRAPAFLGSRFQRPDGINAEVLAMAISAAITDRGLDPLVELLLDSTRVDGAAMWTRIAEQVFLLTPGGDGPWLWDQVLMATARHARAANARGEAAMRHVRNLFAWMPSLIVSVIDAQDPSVTIRTHVMGHTHAVVASHFELLYLPDSTTKRYPLRPALRYGTVEEAAHALVEHLAVLTTGSEYINSLVND